MAIERLRWSLGIPAQRPERNESVDACETQIVRTKAEHDLFKLVAVAEMAGKAEFPVSAKARSRGRASLASDKGCVTFPGHG